jgi:hypothetical protein
MKKTAQIIIILISNLIFGNKIDELKTTKEVEDFIKFTNPDFAKERFKNYDYGTFRIESNDSIFSKIKCSKVFNINEINNWEKIDLNNDGLTDLLFISHYYGYSQYAIIDKGKDSFQLIRLLDNFDSCEFIKTIKVQNKNQIKIRKAVMRAFGDIRSYSAEDSFTIDTLTYKFGTFIELNSKSQIKSDINSIEIKTSGCYGICPSFELKIFENGNMEFNGLMYTKFNGKAKSKLDLKKLTEIEELINYIEIKKLKDNYSVRWTDDQTINLKITFKDGTTKNIEDYGLRGTYGLKTLYEKLIEIGVKTEWN